MSYVRSARQPIWSLGDVLMWTRKHGAQPRTTWITPWHIPSHTSAWKATLWSLGTEVIMRTHSCVRASVEVEDVISLLSSVSQLRRQGTWSGGRWTCTFGILGTGPRLLQEVQHQERGSPDLHGLQWLELSVLGSSSERTALSFAITTFGS